MSVVEDIPGVTNAVQHLEELGHRMRSDDFGFNDDDVSNLDKIIEALYEMEYERKSIREKFETESIKASILRHDLKVLPGRIQEEIRVAVSDARQSNVDALKDLQDQLDEMNNNMANLESKSRELEKENALLHPERELLRQQHEEIISQLNQKMADKATMQIALNETRDKVRQANQDIVDLEDGILQLKEDLIQERTEARHEKKRLKVAVTDTQSKTKEQKEQNVEKKKELDKQHTKLMDSEGKLDVIRKSIRRFEASKNKLEADERALSAHLSKQHRLNETLRRRGAEIVNENLREEQEFETNQRQFFNKIRQYDSDIVKGSDQSGRLEKRRKQLLRDLKDKEALVEEDKQYIEELDEQLQTVKSNLTEKAEDVGRMQTENVEMQQQIEQLAESHQAVLSQLNKQIEEYRDQLSKERRERLELQEVKDDIGKNLDDMKTNQQQFISNVSEVIQENKMKHSNLSNEGQSLQKTIKEEENQIESINRELTTVQKAYEELYNNMSTKVEHIESEIASMEKDVVEKREILSEKSPVFEELESFFNRRSEEYDTMKKEIVTLKNKKLGLEDSIKRAIKDRDALKVPQEALREDLKENRGKVMSQIQSQATDTKNIEEQIFLAGCQLRMVMEENKKFEDACKTVTEELADLEKQKLENEKIKVTAQAELENEKSELSKKWQADNVMQQFFASRDEATAEAFGQLLEKTEKRETKIEDISGRLQDELELLSDFLDNLSTRRPQVIDSAKSIKLASPSPQSAIGMVADVNKHLSPPTPSRQHSIAKSQGQKLTPRTPVTLEKSEVCTRSRTNLRSPLNRFAPSSPLLSPVSKRNKTSL